MRIAFYILAIASLVSCTKEDSFFVPIHANSFAWAMENKTHIYSNTTGDSVSTTSISETKYNENEVSLEGLPNGSYGEKYTQVLEVDSLFEYTTVLLTEFTNGNRNDVVIIDALGFNIYGRAEPDFSLIGTFADSLILNGMTYNDVYHQTDVSQNTSLFVNVENGLIGFTIEQDTFNLVN